MKSPATRGDARRLKSPATREVTKVQEAKEKTKRTRGRTRRKIMKMRRRTRRRMKPKQMK